MELPDLVLEAWAWLLLFVLSSLLTLLAITAQTALGMSSRPRLRLLAEGRVKGAQSALKMLEEDSPTPTLLLLLLFLGIGGGAASLTATVTNGSLLQPWEQALIVFSGGVTLVVLSIITRSIAAARPEAMTVALGPVIRGIALLAQPLILPLTWIERRTPAVFGGGRSDDGPTTFDDLRLMVESVEEARKLEADEREMIHGIFGMSARPVREVMVPRIDVVAVPRESTLGDLLDKIVETGYSRIPIVEDSIDNVIGLIYAKDVLRALRAGSLSDLAEPIARAAYFVPDTKKVDELLGDLQQKRVHLAIVVDEYGGTAGVVSIEDLLEEIVGEIRDEYDVNEEMPIQKLDEYESIVDARVSIRDLNEELDLHLDVEELDTLGGLVYHELGKLPIEGDEVRVNGCMVTVLSTEGRRIKKLKVRIVADEEDGA
ncbi:MAG: hemolysin family protein [Chloroflexota bacterium]